MLPVGHARKERARFQGGRKIGLSARGRKMKSAPRAKAAEFADHFIGLGNDSVLYHSLLGWTGRNRFLDHLYEMATIRSSGLPLLNASNGIPGPWRVFEDLSSGLTEKPSMPYGFFAHQG